MINLRNSLHFRKGLRIFKTNVQTGFHYNITDKTTLCSPIFSSFVFNQDYRQGRRQFSSSSQPPKPDEGQNGFPRRKIGSLKIWEFFTSPTTRTILWSVPGNAEETAKFERYLKSKAAEEFEESLFPVNLFVHLKILHFPRLHYQHFLLLKNDPDFSVKSWVSGATQATENYFHAIFAQDEEIIESATAPEIVQQTKSMLQNITKILKVPNEDEEFGLRLGIYEMRMYEDAVRIWVRLSIGPRAFIPFPISFVSPLKPYDWVIG
eukprot:snap_masked-scaffold_55-processed-gene-1.25-mRNA-1 protein AED:1.00 eAED:1.00 QI:0/-1/0/0/-1/1/1/0/263